MREPGGQRGRLTTDDSYHRFGRVTIDGIVLAVAAGNSHALVMTNDKIWEMTLNNQIEVIEAEWRK